MQVSRENVDEFVLATVFNDNGAVEGFQILANEQEKVMSNQDKMKVKTAKLNAEDKKLITTTNHLSKAFRALFAVFALKKIIDYSAQWTSIRKTIGAITTDENRRKSIEDGLYKTAISTRQSLEQTASLYKGLYTATRSLNISDETRLQLLTNINKALAIGGGSIEENEHVVKQLLRALASGELKPRAIFQLIDTAPQLANMIADGFGVSIEKLREMAKDGKLTSDKVFNAILSQTNQIDKKFKNTGMTLRQAFTNLSTAISKLVDTDLSGPIAWAIKAIDWLANSMWALQTIFTSFLVGKGIKMILYLKDLRKQFLELRAPINTVKNALQMVVSGDIKAGFISLIAMVKKFTVASWAAVAPWLLLVAVITSLLIIIDQLISIFTRKESLTKQAVFGIGDWMTGQNKSATLGKTYLGTGGQAVRPAVYPTSNNSNTNIKNDFTFNINGSQSPTATGREIERILTTRLRQVGAV